MLRGPQGVELPRVEAGRAFLQLLFEQAGQIFRASRREEVIAALSREPWNFDPRRVDVLLYRFRGKVMARFYLAALCRCA